MRALHFVRHGPVTVDMSRPSEEWELAPDASLAVIKIAERLRRLQPQRIVASHHVKTKQTADILSGILRVPVQIRPGLEEHHRKQKDLFSSRAAFDKAMTDFFKHPGKIVLGTESAEMVHKRFSAALNAIMAETDNDEIIVTHGAVMAVILERAGNGSAADIWLSLKQPDYVVVQWPALQIIPG